MQNQNRCIICDAQKDAVHHVNGNDEDNAEKNRVPVCSSCHSRIHYGTTMRTLPWFAKLPESARRQPLPKIGRKALEGRHKTAYRMDVRIQNAYSAMWDAIADTDSHEMSKQYQISGIDVNSKFVHQFTSKIVARSQNDVYEHRIYPVVLEKQGTNCVLTLSQIDEEVGGTSRACEAYRAFLTALNKRQWLRGHGGEVSESHGEQQISP